MSNPLSHIQELAYAGNIEPALAELGQLLDTEPTQEAHLLRCELILDHLDSYANAQMLATSYAWLIAQTEPIFDYFEDLNEQVGQVIFAIVSPIQDTFDTPDMADLVQLDVLLPLGDYFPIIYFARGMMIWNHLQSTKGSSRFSGGGGGWDKYNETRAEHKFPKAIPAMVGKSREQAIFAFEKTLQLMELDSLYYQAALYPLISLYVHAEKYETVIPWLHKALEVDTGEPEKMIELRLKIGQALLPQVSAYLEALLEDDDAAQFSEIIAQHPALQELPLIQITQADCYLRYLNDIEAARPLYTSLLTHKKSTAKPDLTVAQMNALEAVTLLIEAQQDENTEDDSQTNTAEELDDSKDPLDILEQILKQKDTPPEPKKRSRFGRSSDSETRTKPTPNTLPIAQRAQFGLLTIYDLGGEWQEALALLKELIEKAETSQKAHLLDWWQRLEQQVFTQEFTDLAEHAADLFNAEKWSAALPLYAEICQSEYAEKQHFAKYILLANEADYDAEHLRHLLKSISPSDLQNLPLDLVTNLLDRLVATEQWHFVEQTRHLLPLHPDWHIAYDTSRQVFLEDKREHLQALVTNHASLVAIELAHELLAITPDDSPILINLAEAMLLENQWTDARQILETLPASTDKSLLDQVIMMLAEIDIHEGKTAEAQERLAAMQSAQSVSQLQSIRYRLQNAPYIQVKQDIDGLWHAIFGVELSAIYQTKHVPRIFFANAEFLVGIHRASQLEEAPHFAWRYYMEDGKLQVTLLCRVQGASRQEAINTSTKLWDVINYTLPFKAQHIYQYQPIFRLDRLEKLLAPFDVQSAVQILRRERVKQVGTQSLYKVDPIRIYEGNMHQMLQILQSSQAALVLDIHFQPTEVLPWENKAILRMALVDKDDMQDTGRLHGRDIMLKELEENVAHNSTARANFQMLNGLDELPYLVRIHMASNAPISPAIADMTALDLFGGAPYVTVQAYNEEELAIVQQNIAEVRGNSWGLPNAPDDLERWRHLFSFYEASTATRLPLPNANGIPGLSTLSVRMTQMPTVLPTTGTVIGESIVPIQGRLARLKISHADRLRHTYVVGRTGTGKSTLLQNMALQDIEEGYGVAVIDPHGDLVENILDRIPAHRQHDVILFDPSDALRPVGFNMLDVEGSFARSIVVSDFIGLMYQIFDPKRIGMVGPRFENAVRNSMLASMEIEGATFIEVVRMMTDSKYREKCINIIQDPIVKSYWRDIAVNFSSWDKGEMMDYVTSKFGRFNNDLTMRNIIGQSKNTLNFNEIIHDGKIFLVNLSKGKIGSEISHFLGLILVPQFLIATLGRAHIAPADRRMFCLYVDEFHNFTTPAFATLLSEARKYGVALTMANQFISQLEDGIRESVFGNVGTLAAFRVGVKDAHFLAEEFYPNYGENDLINLPNFYMITKMLVDGNSTAPFPIRTLANNFPSDLIGGQKIRQSSQRRYGRDTAMVTHEINQRFSANPKLRK